MPEAPLVPAGSGTIFGLRSSRVVKLGSRLYFTLFERDYAPETAFTAGLACAIGVKALAIAIPIAI